MGYTLHALFLEIDNKFVFYNYYWKIMDATMVGETAFDLIDKKVTCYKLEEHKVSKNFNFRNENSYEILADNYEVVYSD